MINIKQFRTTLRFAIVSLLFEGCLISLKSEQALYEAIRVGIE
jgi:hypothetical protein